VKEPAGLSHDDGKRPDGATLLPWAKGKPLALDVTVPDTYADSHLDDTATTAGAAADKAAGNKEAKYRQQPHLHASCHRVSRDMEPPSSGVSAGVRPTTTDITEDTREATHLFQWLSVALQRSNAVSLHSTFTTD